MTAAVMRETSSRQFSSRRDFSSSNNDPNFVLFEEEDYDDDYEEALEYGDRRATTNSQHQQSNDSVLFAPSEAKSAQRIRSLFILVLILSATLVGIATHRYTSSQEADAFETRFFELADQMSHIVQLNAQNTLNSHEAWSLQLSLTANTLLSTTTTTTSDNNTSNNTDHHWPYVTIPHWELQAQQSLQNIGARVVGIAPIIRNTKEDVSKWNLYSALHGQEWMMLQESQQQQQHNNNGTVSPYIFPESSNEDDNKLVLPIWQHSPLDPGLVNYNAAKDSFVPEVVASLLSSSSAAKTNNNSNAATTTAVLSPCMIQVTDTQTPESFLAVPIYGNPPLQQQQLGEHRNGKSNTSAAAVTAILFAYIPWADLLANLALEGVERITMVVRNPCVSEQFSYEIRGSQVDFVGWEDAHDMQYDFLKVSLVFQVFGSAVVVQNDNDDDDDDDTTTNNQTCTNTIHMFPTQDFEDDYVSNKPMVYTVASFMIFVLCALFFVLYDVLVQKWRKKVELVSRRNSAIVSSLFPPNVRDRLIQHAENSEAGGPDDSYKSSGTTSGGDHHLFASSSSNNNNNSGGTLIPGLSRIGNIHDLIPNLRHLNPMRLLEEISNLSVKEKQRNNHQNQHQQHGSTSTTSVTTNRTSTTSSIIMESQPIADLFPSATVLFGDIAGFTAWSSEREPPQVFTLLETIYNAFDRVAKRRRVFKVETIGDCYMAATGLPEVRPDHAVMMAGFARECLVTMNEVVRELEVRLGPDTAELAMRFGIHSGPVTAGVLRGEKSRFQLFGDTVNTASRMESTGQKHKIQISQETTDLLLQANKGNWIEPRADLVDAKGKGKLQTYWLSVGATALLTEMTRTGSSRVIEVQPPRRGSIMGNDWDGSYRYMPTEEEVTRSINQKTERMINWNVDVLMRLLKMVVAMRLKAESSSTLKDSEDGDGGGDAVEAGASGTDSTAVRSLPVFRATPGHMVLDESMVKDTITIPDATTTSTGSFHGIADLIQLSSAAESQLRDYVAAIAFMYHDNCFHSFEHASHVTRAATKFLAGIVEPNHRQSNSFDEDDDDDSESRMVEPTTAAVAATNTTATDTPSFHQCTYDLASDPLTQFGVVLSALIHDVDHPGVPNAQLVKEDTEVSQRYKGRSVSEQNSIDVAWNLLMEPCYADLRSCIYTTQDELDRFRELVVTTVMATDIADKELDIDRKRRWIENFEIEDLQPSADVLSRKARIVLECLVEASDVSHTMQHWHIYVRWNERFFHECYRAFRTGRTEVDPIEGWYEGELEFFDFYIIPLVKKLKTMQVIGVTADEYLSYAQANREEWESKGREIVVKYLASYKEVSNASSDEEIICV